MPKSKPPRKRLSRQVREEYIVAARQRAMKRRQRLVAFVSVGLAIILGLFGVTSLTGRSDDSADDEQIVTETTSEPDRSPAECPPEDGARERRTIFDKQPRICIDLARKYSARFVTSAGVIVAELDPEQSPKAANNFIFLARWRFYDGLPFHKAIPNNYIQTGDPKGAGITGPGYFFQDDPLPPAGSYQIGDLLVAHEAPNQNGSQFLILVGDGPQGTLLPPAFPRFGRITRGLDVAQRIASDGALPGDDKIEHLIQSVEITPLDE